VTQATRIGYGTGLNRVWHRHRAVLGQQIPSRDDARPEASTVIRTVTSAAAPRQSIDAIDTLYLLKLRDENAVPSLPGRFRQER
jgi:hypothetical protein